MRTVQTAHIVYLVKVVVGLLSVTSVCAVALALPGLDFSGGLKETLIILCALFFFGLFPFIYKIYRRMDELQKRLHEHASVFAMTFFVSSLGIVGVLQANQMLPLFNQFITLPIAIAVWGAALSVVDRFYKTPGTQNE